MTLRLENMHHVVIATNDDTSVALGNPSESAQSVAAAVETLTLIGSVQESINSVLSRIVL